MIFEKYFTCISNRNYSMELVEVSCFYVSYCNWNSVVICLGIWISAIMSVTSNHQFILTNLRIFFNKISCSDLFNDAAKCKSDLFWINVLSISYVDLARTKLECTGYSNSERIEIVVGKCHDI